MLLIFGQVLHLEGCVLCIYALLNDYLLAKFMLPHLFSNAEWNIFVFDHVHDLALHCQDK